MKTNILQKIKTDGGNEVLLIEKIPENYEKTVLIIGVFHGDEPDGEYLISRWLHENESRQTKNRMLFIPCLNPDGRIKGGRVNGNGVDLNRNFPTSNWETGDDSEYYGGKRPASEQETRFVLYVIERYKPSVILTLHEPYRIVNFDGPEKETLEIAEKIGKITNYEIQKEIGYPTPGSFGTYCGDERNIPTITLELPENEDKDVLWNANKGVFDYLSEI